MSVSFYNNKRSREGEDLDCVETIAELTLRILFHHDESYQNNSEINILILRKGNVHQAKQDLGCIYNFFANSCFSLPLPFLFSPNPR